MATPITSAHVPSASLAAIRILVVEDDPENVILLRAYLDSGLPLLDFAVNGLEALEKRRLSDHDVILMDMQMPVMDGYSATRQIRAWETANGKSRVPIIAVTAHAIEGSLGNSIEAGCDAHLTKPVERPVLLQEIARLATPVHIEQARSTEVTLRIPAGTSDGISESIKARRPAFLANRWRDLEKLRAALSLADFGAMRKIAHDCKGIGTGYGFPEISSLGLQISTAAKAFDTDKLEECLKAFEACLTAASN